MCKRQDCQQHAATLCPWRQSVRTFFDAELIDRELEVFRLIGEGHGTRQIAEALHLSVKTVESYQAHIKEKLSLRSARELVQHAVEWTVREKTA